MKTRDAEGVDEWLFDLKDDLIRINRAKAELRTRIDSDIADLRILEDRVEKIVKQTLHTEERGYE